MSFREQLLELTAPADLVAGYKIEAEARGETYLAEVPSSGVKAGEKFTAKAIRIPPPSSKAKIPGVWKDGIFSFCKYGCCHIHLCLTCWCRPLALAQVMTRMRLNWMGNRGSVRQVETTFCFVRKLFFNFIILILGLNVASILLYPQFSEMRDVTNNGNNNNDDQNSNGISSSYWRNETPKGALLLSYAECTLSMLFCFYLIVVTCKTRRAVREEYHIKDKCCGCEDLCCSLLCGCCVTKQMMRQSADYDNHRGHCCTKNGLPLHLNAV